MKIEILVVGPIQTNCYLIINEERKTAIIVDPGANGKGIVGRLKDEGLTPEAILLTHGHYDHTDGIPKLRMEFPEIKVYALDAERETLENTAINLSMANKVSPADYYVHDNDKLTISDFEFSVIATPGHTKGGCCYYFEKDSVVFTGDTLFAGSIGRTDFPGGDLDTLINSIKTRLYTLPDETLALPGHMESTSIGREKESNIFTR